MRDSKYFNSDEFRCKCKCNDFLLCYALLDVLEDVRAHFNVPVHINSAYRCKEHNKEIGGSPTSQHLKGMAADIVVKNTHPKEVADYLESKYPSSHGIGRYKTFTHIDVREKRARWGANA